LSIQLSSRVPCFQILENKRDYTVIIDEKVYKMNAIGSCDYLGEGYDLSPSQKKVSFNNAPTAIKNKIFGILEKYYGY
jgi:hypothetical protein